MEKLETAFAGSRKYSPSANGHKHQMVAPHGFSGLRTNADEIQVEITKTQSPWGPYITEALLGTGGWSKVYQVTKTSTEEKLAGKLSEAKRQLREEAAILRSLSHVSPKNRPG